MIGRMLPLGKDLRDCMAFARIIQAYVTEVILLPNYGISPREILHLSACY